MIKSMILALALGVAAPAAAQTAPDTAQLAAARELMQVTDIRGQMRAIGPRMAESVGMQMRTMFKDDQMPDGLRVELTAAMQAYVGSMDSIFTPAFVDQMAAIYARHFTVEELRRLISFMREPVMRKFRDETPAMMTEMMPMTIEAMKPGQQQFMAKVRQIVSDWIAKHPQDRAKLRSPAAS